MCYRFNNRAANMCKNNTHTHNFAIVQLSANVNTEAGSACHIIVEKRDPYLCFLFTSCLMLLPHRNTDWAKTKREFDPKKTLTSVLVPHINFLIYFCIHSTVYFVPKSWEHIREEAEVWTWTTVAQRKTCFSLNNNTLFCQRLDETSPCLLNTSFYPLTDIRTEINI